MLAACLRLVSCSESPDNLSKISQVVSTSSRQAGSPGNLVSDALGHLVGADAQETAHKVFLLDAWGSE